MVLKIKKLPVHTAAKMWAYCEIHVGIGLGNKRETQLSSCVPVVYFRGATMSRPLGYEGRQPGCIPSVSTIPVKSLRSKRYFS